MVNLVIVSHSAQLGEGVGALARQMLMGGDCKIAIAAGIDDPENPIGTDPIKVMEAIESVADTDHVLVMMDIGSALLSAETALELLDPAIAAKAAEQGLQTATTQTFPTMARAPECIKFAQQHNMAVVTIEDLVAYRREHERKAS